MKIRSLEDLEQRLSTDLIWRKRELADLKSLIETRSFSPSKQNAVLRSGIALLYAHWEGYIKTAATSYLEFVSRQQLTYEELSINFVAIAMKTELDKAQVSNKATIHTEVTAFILTQANQRSSIPYKGIVSTNSNLSSTILQEIVCLLGLDNSFYQSKDKIIDEKLLSRRNQIAHGEYLDSLSLDQGEYQELQKEILAMMEDFRNQVENNASQKLFCRNCLS
jgi:MAE_28990/MAE_18760-like HEPN